jgi:hypothetical protein
VDKYDASSIVEPSIYSIIRFMEPTNSTPVPPKKHNPIILILAGVAVVMIAFALIGYFSGRGSGWSAEDKLNFMAQFDGQPTRTAAEQEAFLNWMGKDSTSSPEDLMKKLENLDTNKRK